MVEYIAAINKKINKGWATSIFLFKSNRLEKVTLYYSIKMYFYTLLIDHIYQGADESYFKVLGFAGIFNYLPQGF